MSEHFEDYFEAIFVLLIVGAATSLILMLVMLTQEPIINPSEDKSMVAVNGALDDFGEGLTGHDLLLMLMNVDSMTPYPRAVKINDTPVIVIDEKYVASKMGNLAVIYNSGGSYKLSTLLDKQVVSQEYVYDDVSDTNGDGEPDSPYIHYVLED
jgi:hypothetical protein